MFPTALFVTSFLYFFAYVIIKKVVPNAFDLLEANGIEGAVGHPYPIREEG
ncbi:MAG: hypothetical protein GF317_09790 [Candidatus Lokiarchaeota archaeon]|nr:hypothetical protein [Candidatus Lokiarchaeota archaeon]